MIALYSDIPGFVPPGQHQISNWLEKIASQHSQVIGELSYVFCDDNIISKINRQFLNHDYPTDIITFPYSYNPIEAEIYVSIDTVKSNASHLGIPFESELLRVIAHGLLHMLGYDDKTTEDTSVMREQEEKTIQLYYSLYPENKSKGHT